MLRALNLVLAAALVPAMTAAQSSSSLRIEGTVRDSAGSAVSDARVLLDDRQIAVSDARGAFVADVRAYATPVTQALRVSAGGFRTWTAELRQPPDARVVRIDVVLAPAVLRLEPLNVLGQRPEVLRATGGAAAVIGPERLAEERPVATQEVLRRTPGVHVMDEDPLGVNLNIGVRGLNPRRSARVLLLEDGVPIHLGPYGDPTAHYQPPAAALHRVEIVTGSGQIMHGPQTVGGVINFVRIPPASRTGGTVIGTLGDHGRRGLFVRADAASQGHTVGASYDLREVDGARRGWHHRTDDVGVHAGLRLGGAGTLVLRGAWYREDSRFGEGGLTQAEYEADPFMNPTSNDVFDLVRWSGLAAYTVELGERAGIALRAYAHDTDRTSWRQASSSGDRFGTDRYAQSFGCSEDAASIDDCGFQGRPRRYRVAGIEPRVHAETPLGVIDAGVRAHRETAHRTQYLAPGPSLVDASITRDNMLATTAYSAFTQLRAAGGAWTFTPGLRLEHVRAGNENRIRGDASADSYTQLVPGAGITWSRTPRLTLFGGVHRGFAPPRPADILTNAPGESLVRVDPELSTSYELGVRSRPLPPLGVDVTLFRTDFSNQIVEGGLTGSGQRFVNAGATLHQGLEVLASLHPDPARAIAPLAEVAWTWVRDAEFRSDRLSSVDEETSVRGNRLPFAPRHMLHATVGFRTTFGTALRLRTDHVSAQFSDDLNTALPTADGQRGVLPAYTVYGLTLNQRVPRTGATLFARIDNLTDRVYITERLEGIMVGMPRRLAIGVERAF